MRKPKKLVRYLAFSCNFRSHIDFTELWHIFHSELDLDGNGRLDAEELGLALKKAGSSCCVGEYC